MMVYQVVRKEIGQKDFVFQVCQSEDLATFQARKLNDKPVGGWLYMVEAKKVSA